MYIHLQHLALRIHYIKYTPDIFNTCMKCMYVCMSCSIICMCTTIMYEYHVY